MDQIRNGLSRAGQSLRRMGRRKRYVLGGSALLLVGGLTLSSPFYGRGAAAGADFEVQSLDGSGNNPTHADLGRAGTVYQRVAAAAYADGRSAPLDQPNARVISNRVFNDTNQDLVSDRGVSQWASAWGGFVANTISLPDGPGVSRPIAFSRDDPLERFTNPAGTIAFTRSRAAPGTGIVRPQEQVNTVSSYLDASTVYGGTESRLEWLRVGPVDNNLTNNSALLLLPGGQLPRGDVRGDEAKAPPMLIEGRLAAQPTRAAIAGDVRANQSVPLLAVQTLFAREHNRIVAKLPASLTDEQKFQIARRVVIAEQQYITYNEFLPAMGVRLDPYRGYNPRVDPTVTNEFATVALSLDSMTPGKLQITTDAARYQPPALAALKASGVTLNQGPGVGPGQVGLAVPANVASFAPDLLAQLQLGPVLQSLSLARGSRNDEQVDDQFRSVQSQVPSSADPSCLDGPTLPRCFNGVGDLPAAQVERGRDHGIALYNDLRRSFNLPPKRSFDAVTGESSASFPADPALTPGQEINDPNSLDFVKLFNAAGTTPSADGASAQAVVGVRRTPVAARLKAIYGTVDRTDSFVGAVCEPRVPGTELGELQLAMWKAQFTALRDGDRFFYLNDPGLKGIKQAFGIDFRNRLADVIALNTDVPRGALTDNVFQVGDVRTS